MQLGSRLQFVFLVLLSFLFTAAHCRAHAQNGTVAIRADLREYVNPLKLHLAGGASAVSCPDPANYQAAHRKS